MHATEVHFDLELLSTFNLSSNILEVFGYRQHVKKVLDAIWEISPKFPATVIDHNATDWLDVTTDLNDHDADIIFVPNNSMAPKPRVPLTQAVATFSDPSIRNSEHHELSPTSTSNPSLESSFQLEIQSSDPVIELRSIWYYNRTCAIHL